jgi:hypothetical protein
LETILKDRRTTNKLLKSGQLSEVGKIRPLSNRYMGQDKIYLGKAERKLI